MAKKKTTPQKTEPLPGIQGNGVAPLSIPEIDKVVRKYEAKKEARCAASPDEIAAKSELKAILYTNRAQLPLNADGEHFYRLDEVDYCLSTKLKRKRVGGDEEDEE